MGMNRRGRLSHLMSLLHSPITHVLCWAVRKEQGPFFPLPPCFWTDLQRNTSYIWLRPESAGHVLSPSQHFPPESPQLFHSNLMPSDNQTSALKMCPWWYGRLPRSWLVIILCFPLLSWIMLGTIYWQRWITEGNLWLEGYIRVWCHSSQEERCQLGCRWIGKLRAKEQAASLELRNSALKHMRCKKNRCRK